MVKKIALMVKEVENINVFAFVHVVIVVLDSDKYSYCTSLFALKITFKTCLDET